MRTFILALLLALIGSILLAQTGVEPSMGTGEYEGMYLVESWSNLYWISQNSTSWNRSYIQISDIDFADTGIENWDDGKGWKPIGNNGTAFTGTYDGNGHSISHLNINRPLQDYIGLFGKVTSSSRERKLFGIRVIGANVTGKDHVGILAGEIHFTEVYQCSVFPNQNNITTVRGVNYVGGLVGTSTASGNDRSLISYSFTNVSVIFTGTRNNQGELGGLVGRNSMGNVSNCFSLGYVNGENSSGTLAKGVGGLVGYIHQGTVSNSFSAVVVLPQSDVPNNHNYGGFAGSGGGGGNIFNSYWDTETSGYSSSAGATGLPTEEMLVIFNNWDSEVWTVIDGVSYPYLSWQEPPAETVTPVRPLEPENGGGSNIYRRTFNPQQQEKTLVFTANETDNGSATISFVYTTDPSHSSVQLLSNPEALSAYYGFTFTPESVLLEGQTFKLQFPHQPNSIWFRRGGDWQMISGINTNSPEEPDFSYTISVQDLPSTSRADSHQIEFAADRGGTETLPVELSSFTAIVTADMAVMLEWTAETETNMLGYNIFRSESINLTDAVKANFVIIPAHNTSVALDYSYVDKDVESGRLYYYWLQSNDLDLTHEFHGPISVLVEQQGETGTILEPEKHTELTGAYPNPFNPATAIRFTLTEPANVNISIYNSLGQLMTNLANNRFYTVGNHSLAWDGKDSYGRNAGSGIYFYRMVTDSGYEMTKRMTLLK
jgi:hypothetical protein